MKQVKCVTIIRNSTIYILYSPLLFNCSKQSFHSMSLSNKVYQLVVAAPEIFDWWAEGGARGRDGVAEARRAEATAEKYWGGGGLGGLTNFWGRVSPPSPLGAATAN